MKLGTTLALTVLMSGMSQLALACPLLKPVGTLSCGGGGPATITKQRAFVSHWNAGGTSGCFSNSKFKLIDTTDGSTKFSGNIGVGGLTTPPLTLAATRTYKFQILNPDNSLLSEDITKVAPSCGIKLPAELATKSIVKNVTPKQ